MSDAARVGPKRPAPRPRPNPRLDNPVFGPEPPRLVTWLINGAIVAATVAWGVVFALMVVR